MLKDCPKPCGSNKCCKVCDPGYSSTHPCPLHKEQQKEQQGESDPKK